MLHLTARADHGFPLSDPNVARRLWSGLRRAFPDALSCCLMGNHLHLLVDEQPVTATRKLRSALGRTKGTWRVAEPEWIRPSPTKMRRQLRYIALNPCRARLCGDPMAWIWSTHRDVLGASIDPWVPAERVAHLGSPAELHAYISKDPSVSVSGSPLPQVRPWLHGLGDIALAAQVASRADATALTRRTATRRAFLQLARIEGFERPALLAEICEATPRTVYRAWERADISRPAQLCLHDDRLLGVVRPKRRHA